MINSLRYLKLKKSTQQYTTHKWLHLLQVVDWALDWQNQWQEVFLQFKNITTAHLNLQPWSQRIIGGIIFVFIVRLHCRASLSGRRQCWRESLHHRVHEGHIHRHPNPWWHYGRLPRHFAHHWCFTLPPAHSHWPAVASRCTHQVH